MYLYKYAYYTYVGLMIPIIISIHNLLGPPFQSYLPESFGTSLILGDGRYPSKDPWGVPFSDQHDPIRYQLAGIFFY